MPLGIGESLLGRVDTSEHLATKRIILPTTNGPREILKK